MFETALVTTLPLLNQAGLGADAEAWRLRLASLEFDGPSDTTSAASDAQRMGVLVAEGWDCLARMPLRSRRDAAERAAGEAIVRTMANATLRFARRHRETIYRQLTDDFRHPLRADELVWQAAERWPGLVPTRAECADEARRMQKDKDGREIAQGMLLSQWLADPRIGRHLALAMLRPTEEAEQRLAEFVARGRLDLGPVHIEARDGCGYVHFRHPRFLNAEDAETLGPQEVAVDLILLHPGLQMGVLRGDPVPHAKHAGRRVFSAGLNLTRLYHGEIPYLFYMVRDLGLVNKLYRGHTRAGFDLDEAEDTIEKPWLAVVESFAIGGGCQLLLVMDSVIAEQGAWLSLPARKEGIIPGAANLRLPRYVGEAIARQAIMFDRRFQVDEPAAAAIVSRVYPAEEIEAAMLEQVRQAIGSGMVSASGNRKALRVQTEPLDRFREYMALYAREQALCHLSGQLIANLERHWQAQQRRL
jgi:thioesterase DpgC